MKVTAIAWTLAVAAAAGGTSMVTQPGQAIRRGDIMLRTTRESVAGWHATILTRPCGSGLPVAGSPVSRLIARAASGLCIRGVAEQEWQGTSGLA